MVGFVLDKLSTLVNVRMWWVDLKAPFKFKRLGEILKCPWKKIYAVYNIHFSFADFNTATTKRIIERRRIVQQKRHGSYRWIIMLEKCGQSDLNVFHLKWIIGTHGNGKNQNPWGRFRAGSSKTTPRILIFFNCHGCRLFI